MGKAPHCCGASQPENPVTGEPHFGFFREGSGGSPPRRISIMAYPWVSTQGERDDIPYLF